MNSWLYLPAEDFARSDDIDFTRACVHFWQDDTGVCRAGCTTPPRRSGTTPCR